VLLWAASYSMFIWQFKSSVEEKVATFWAGICTAKGNFSGEVQQWVRPGAGYMWVCYKADLRRH
jgi:hypothetical protein